MKTLTALALTALAATTLAIATAAPEAQARPDCRYTYGRNLVNEPCQQNGNLYNNFVELHGPNQHVARQRAARQQAQAVVPFNIFTFDGNANGRFSTGAGTCGTQGAYVVCYDGNGDFESRTYLGEHF